MRVTIRLRLLIRARANGIALARSPSIVVIQMILVAGDSTASQVTVSTMIDINTSDPRWAAAFVDTIAFQAQEGARQLSSHLLGAQRPPTGFVPLAALIGEAAR
mgnify:CR=1 FL=1